MAFDYRQYAVHLAQERQRLDSGGMPAEVTLEAKDGLGNHMRVPVERVIRAS
jgi:hypothetical protein